MSWKVKGQFSRKKWKREMMAKYYERGKAA